MLTRHFYKEDEVQAALQWCVCRGRIKEAMFWCQELIDSNLSLECFHGLLHTWVLFKGVGSLTWLTRAVDVFEKGEFSEEDIQLLTYQLACVPSTLRDDTVLSLLFLGMAKHPNTPDHVVDIPPGKGADPWEDCVLQAAYQKKCEFLWLLLRSEWTTRDAHIWSILQIATFDKTGTKTKALQNILRLEACLEDTSSLWFIRALGVAIVCLQDNDLKAANKPLRAEVAPDIKKNLVEWEQCFGRKARREYTIPRDCLYWITERGLMPYTRTTLDEIQDLTDWLDPNPYWSEALEGRAYRDLTLEERVDFSEVYFPDGHPMTWSAAELAKSHGSGILRPDETICLSRFLRVYCTGISSRIVWKGWERALRIMIDLETKMNLSNCKFETLFGPEQTRWTEELRGWNLKPITQRVFIRQE